MPKKQTSSKLSKLAGKVLGGKKATPKRALSLAGSVLGQDERPTRGPPKKAKR
jgi:hypothetical protein